jgi:hypothetical protein
MSLSFFWCRENSGKPGTRKSDQALKCLLVYDAYGSPVPFILPESVPGLGRGFDPVTMRVVPPSASFDPYAYDGGTGMQVRYVCMYICMYVCYAYDGDTGMQVRYVCMYVCIYVCMLCL